MICAITGQLRRVDDDRIEIGVGPLAYELLVPAADVEELRTSMGREITLHTIMYLEGDAARGNLEPRLIGFLRPQDKAFFDLFTTVKGIGPKTALRALSAPIAQIASAIESRDSRYLVGLKGIGKRTAELIIAELGGKVRRFAAEAMAGKPAAPARRGGDEEDAIQALVALGERRMDAETLLDRARQLAPNLKATDELVREMLRLRTARG